MYMSPFLSSKKKTHSVILNWIENNIRYIVPSIKGSSFITGQQELYVSSDDPFPEGYKLNDTWPQNIL